MVSHLEAGGRFMTDFELREVELRRQHDALTARRNMAGHQERDRRNGQIALINSGIKRRIDAFLGDQDGQREINLNPQQAVVLIAKTSGRDQNEISLQSEWVARVTREMSRYDIVFMPLQPELYPGEMKEMQSMFVNGPFQGSDFNAFAKEEISAQKQRAPRDIMAEELASAKRWDVFTSLLLEPQSAQSTVVHASSRAAA